MAIECQLRINAYVSVRAVGAITSKQQKDLDRLGEELEKVLQQQREALFERMRVHLLLTEHNDYVITLCE